MSKKYKGWLAAGAVLLAGVVGITMAGGPAAVAASLVSYTQFDAATKSKVDNVRAFASNADANQTIAKQSGPIATNGTVLTGIDKSGFSGVFIATLSGQVDRTLAAGTPGLQVQPQLSLWRDCDNDGVFEWQTGEGYMSPNATIPDAKNRSVTINGTQVVSSYKACHWKVMAHAYASNGAPYVDAAELKVGWATLTLVPIR